MRGIALVLALVGTFVAAACSSDGETGPDASPAPDASAELTQSAEAGGVTVEATWLTAGDAGSVDADLSTYPLDRFALFDVKLDTHSGDLSSIDMAQTAALSQDGRAVKPEVWLDVDEDSHHREGVLVFPRDAGEGGVTLSVDVGGQTVTLAWQTQP